MPERAEFRFAVKQSLETMAEAERLRTGRDSKEPGAAWQIALSLRNGGLAVGSNWTNQADRAALLAELRGSARRDDSLIYVKEIRIENFVSNVHDDSQLVGALPTVIAQDAETAALVDSLGGDPAVVQKVLRAANLDPSLTRGPVVTSLLPVSARRGVGGNMCLMKRGLDGETMEMALHCGRYSEDRMLQDVYVPPGATHSYVRKGSPIERLVARRYASSGSLVSPPLVADANGFVAMPHDTLAPHMERIRMYLNHMSGSHALSPDFALHIISAPRRVLGKDGNYVQEVRPFDSGIRLQLEQLEGEKRRLEDKVNRSDRLYAKADPELRDLLDAVRQKIHDKRDELQRTYVKVSGTIVVEYYRLPLSDTPYVVEELPAPVQISAQAAPAAAEPLGAAVEGAAAPLGASVEGAAAPLGANAEGAAPLEAHAEDGGDAEELGWSRRGGWGGGYRGGWGYRRPSLVGGILGGVGSALFGPPAYPPVVVAAPPVYPAPYPARYPARYPYGYPYDYTYGSRLPGGTYYCSICGGHHTAGTPRLHAPGAYSVLSRSPYDPHY